MSASSFPPAIDNLYKALDQVEMASPFIVSSHARKWWKWRNHTSLMVQPEIAIGLPLALLSMAFLTFSSLTLQILSVLGAFSSLMTTLYFVVEKRQVQRIIEQAHIHCIVLEADNTFPPLHHYLDPVSLQERQKIMSLIENIPDKSLTLRLKTLIKRNDIPRGWWDYVSQNATLALSQPLTTYLENPA